MYAAGSTYSTVPIMTNGDKDIALFRFKSTGDVSWVRYWGTSSEEEATGIALDETNGYLYVSGYIKTMVS